PAWAGSGEAAHAAYAQWQVCPSNPGDIQLGAVMEWLEANMPAETIYTNGAGNFSVWLHRFHRYRRLGTQLAPTSGSMGYGFPAAIAAAIVQPETPVVCFAGDGDFLMSAQDLATAMAAGAKPVTIVFNNGILGTIRMHQENHYPGRVSATDLVNPDFAAYAKAFGAHGETVRTTAEFAPAMERALASGKAAVIDLKLDPEAITPRTTLTKLRQAAQDKA
ncbi:MAG: thiamine pyrophosphate-binding protein, partial [Pelagibacterium sp.]|uniref:thiamine pyrophosphate-dependent enzyme n=1 Tax=uncultured Pelagibacterium sp. TaxID=1159875 RepID=UPI000C38E205|nr:thiamine pyrophosphate-binding protein [Pelagibacterium sp.]